MLHFIKEKPLQMAKLKFLILLYKIKVKKFFFHKSLQYTKGYTENAIFLLL